MQRTLEENRARNAAYQRVFRARRRKNLLDAMRAQQQQKQQQIDEQLQEQLLQQELIVKQEHLEQPPQQELIVKQEQLEQLPQQERIVKQEQLEELPQQELIVKQEQLEELPQQELIVKRERLEQLPQQEQISQQELIIKQEQLEQPLQIDNPQQDEQQDHQQQQLPYENFADHYSAHQKFKKNFIENTFGYTCAVCDRLWFKHDMKSIPPACQSLINEHFHNFDFSIARVCSTCHSSLRTNKIPPFSTSNGFKYHSRPVDLPSLDIVTERLISPRLPFMVIRRLRHEQDQYGIYGQIINVPVNVNNMVRALPRNVDDDFAINVHMRRKQIHKSSYIIGMIRKSVIKLWLQYLINTPMFKFYNITIDNSFFNNDNTNLSTTSNIDQDEISEVITKDDSLHAQQQTLLWNEDKYLCFAPAQNNSPISVLLNEHCEELSFPSIYLGEFRNFKEGLNVTPFMIASSELRRTDRRGVTPSHLLYVAMKIMRIRIRDSIKTAFKYIGLNTNLTRADIEHPNFLHDSIDKNLSFLRSIPNSVYYWAQQKRDLFAMLRQLGKPTFFLTLNANEIGWPNLMSLLYKLKNNGADIDVSTLQNMHYNYKATLVNEDPVTCAIYFNKLVNTIMEILQSSRFSPFGNHYVKHFFKRIEFQHRGSTHAHILLWLNDSPNNAISENSSDAVNLIDKLVSVKSTNASGLIKLQQHKHTFTCKKSTNRRSTAQNCRFGAPFMPSKSTVILTPMPTTDTTRKSLRTIYMRMWKSLEEIDYENIDAFLEAHNISCYDTYLKILTSGISRPMVFLQRETYEKWVNPFNPFIFHLLRSNMDFQFITEEYSCAAYVVEYINKTNRGISNLQQNILKTMDEHPEFDIIGLTRQLGINMLNSVELTSQEAAWYLLRQSISHSSVKIIYIPTSWPAERERFRKTNADLERAEIDDASCEICKENLFDKYQKRPAELDDVTLAQFSAQYTFYSGKWKKRDNPRIIRYRNYDEQVENNNFKREMVTLHLPFRDEENDVLADHKCMQLYDSNDALIMQRRHEFESSLDIAKTLEICRDLST